MPDSESYIHPIIQSMVDSAHLKSKAIDQQNQSDQAKEAAKIRREELAAAIKRATDEHAVNMGHLSLAQQQYDLALKDFKTRAEHSILEDIRTGARPVESLPSAPTIPTALNSQPGAPNQTVTPSPASVQPTPNFSMMPSPGMASSQDGNVDVAGTSMPRAAVAQIPDNANRIAGQKEAAVAVARENALSPIIDKRNKAASDLQALRDADTDKRDRQKAVETFQRELTLHNLDNASHERVAKIHESAVMNGVDPGTLDKYVHDVYITGNQKINQVPAKFRSAVMQAAPQGYTPLTDKDQDLLSSVQTLREITDKARKLADFSYDVAPLEAGKTAIGVGNGGALRGEVEGLLGNIAKQVSSEKGRLTNQDIDRAKGLIYSAKLTKAQNLKKVQDLEDMLVKRIKTVTGKYNPSQLKEILQTRGIDPTALLSAGQAAAETPQVENWIRDANGRLVKQ